MNVLQTKKEELKKQSKKGFTLMELLIVVAIIAVLVAIAIPLFTNQLEKVREATDLANIRSAYAVASAEQLTNEDQGTDGVGVATTPAMESEGAFEKGGDVVIGGHDMTKCSVTKGSRVTVKVDANGNVTFEGVTETK